MNKIITISREFGSGGREVGKRLADNLGFAYYDAEIITEIANKTGLTEEYIRGIAENGMISYSFQFAKSFASYSAWHNSQTQVLIEQTKVLKEIAQKGNCIIVGRGADWILREYEPMNIFVYADIESKINRCREKAMEDEQLSDKELKHKILHIDKVRKKYYNLISPLEWGERNNYHLCLNTSNLDIKGVIPGLVTYIENWYRSR